MEVLDLVYYGNALRSWAIALAVAAGAFVGLRLVIGWVVGRLGRFAGATATEMDDIATGLLKSIRPYFLFVLSVYVGARFVALPELVLNAFGAAAVLVALFQVGLSGNVALRAFISGYSRRRVENDAAAATTMRFLGFIGQVLLWVALLLVGLENLGVDVTALVAGLGVGGVAIAFALQNVLADLFGSLAIVLDRPFVIGDFITVDDNAGTVEHIGLKTTRLRSISGEQLVFANGDLLASRIRNFKRMTERRVVFTLGVTYETPPDTLESIPEMIRAAIEAQPRTRFDRAHFKQYGDFSINFEIVYFVLVPDYNVYMDIHQAINLAIFRDFAREGIEFAYPTQVQVMRWQGAPPPAGADAAPVVAAGGAK